MFKINTVILILLSFMVVSAYAADEVMLNFSGTIRNKACEVNPNSITKNVDLGTVGANTFNNAGDVSPAKDFEIQITCASYSPQKATVKFEGISNEQDPALLALDNTQDSAKGIAIQISEKDGSKIDLGSESKVIDISEGDNILQFIARYQAVDSGSNVTVGTANATANFSISYQ